MHPSARAAFAAFTLWCASARAQDLPDPEPTAGPVPPAIGVTVVGQRREVGQTRLSEREIRDMPGAFGDAFRAIEALPGVTPLVSGFPYFYVRGAPPNDSAYYVDGVRIPWLFHLGLGQGVIHPELIDGVDLHPSAAPARFGGAIGGIVSAEPREPAARPRGHAHLRLIDAGALVESPLASGRGSALVAARYGYPGPILGLVSDVELGYWDYQARASFDVSPRDRLSVFGFGGHDYLATPSSSDSPDARGKMEEQLLSDFHRIDLRYDRATAGGRLRLAATGGYDSQGAAPTYVANRSVALRAELDERLSESARVRAGAEGRLDVHRTRITRVGPGEPEVPSSAHPPPTNLTAALHGDVVWRPARRVELVPGVRVELFASARDEAAPGTGRNETVVPAVSPRLSTRLFLGGGVAWLTTLGIAHQYPSLRVGNVPAALVSVPGFPHGVSSLQKAGQASTGFQFALPGGVGVTTTGFYSRFSGLTDLSAACFQDERGVVTGPPQGPSAPPYVCPNNRPVSGRAYGAELLVVAPEGERFNGFVSYTLSRSIRTARFQSYTGTETVTTVPSEFDRTHVFNATSSYDLGRRWKVGGRFLFYTGAPYSKLDGSWPVPPYHAYRTPAFHRVDVRLEKRWLLGPTSSLAFVIEGQNVTLSKEVVTLGMDCEGIGTDERLTTTCRLPEVGPITLPSLGLEAVF